MHSLVHSFKAPLLGVKLEHPYGRILNKLRVSIVASDTSRQLEPISQREGLLLVIEVLEWASFDFVVVVLCENGELPRAIDDDADREEYTQGGTEAGTVRCLLIW